MDKYPVTVDYDDLVKGLMQMCLESPDAAGMLPASVLLAFTEEVGKCFPDAFYVNGEEYDGKGMRDEVLATVYTELFKRVATRLKGETNT